MKSMIGVSVAVGSIICGTAGIMCLTGFGTPNCEPTIMGYVQFWATLFSCGVCASVLCYLVVGICYFFRTIFCD